MLFAIDVGNTNTTLGLFHGDEVVAFWRAETKREWTADELALLIKDFFGLKSMSFSDITGVAIANVVPSIKHAVVSMSERYLGISPIYVDHKNAGLPIAYPNPDEIGADRLVTCVGAYARYPRDLIVIDFGTATTFDYLDTTGAYYGGPIVPGIAISNEALFRHTAKLPRVEIAEVTRLLPRTTIEAIQSGVYQGYVGAVDHIVSAMKREVAGDPLVIATGGLASLVAKHTKAIVAVEKYLTLDGLRVIWHKNR